MSSLPTAASILQRFYEAETLYMSLPEASRDFASTMGATLAADIKLYQSPDLPYSQSLYSGHAGFQTWAREMSALFSSLEVTDAKVFEREGAGEVVVTSVVKVTVRRSGEALEVPLVQEVGVDRAEGVIVWIRSFYWDVRGLREAVGVGE